MAHEITSTDNVVLHKNRAWHGLGVVVEDAPTLDEALTLAGLDWEVWQLPLTASSPDGSRIEVDSHVLNVRSDTGDALGVVGAGWTPIQNRVALVDFVEALAEEGQSMNVRVETMGSIQAGRKVWCLAKGESFAIGRGQDDEVVPYLLVCQGHDGSMALRVVPTSVRVVCRNTLELAVGSESTGWRSTAYTIRHSGDVMDKVAEARQALRHWGVAVDDSRDRLSYMASRDVEGGRQALEEFWTSVYERQFGAIPQHADAVMATSEKARKAIDRKRNRAVSAMSAISARFDIESQRFGATPWVAANAYTWWLQHNAPVRGRDDEARREVRLRSNLFGTNAARTREAVEMAATLA
ncbi:MAG: DUF932 domain-containing protein [Bacteroidetes bacterium]|nr:MAG: DUF932 domain-containing protein [Bacteroidota bacterium]